MTVHMTQIQKQMVRRLRTKGRKNKEIARELNYRIQVIHVTLRDDRTAVGKPDGWSPSPGRLSLAVAH